jgi:hypothetical protein
MYFFIAFWVHLSSALILNERTCTATSVFAASVAHDFVGRTILKGSNPSVPSTRAASFVDKDKALVLLRANEVVEALQYEGDEVLLRVEVAETKLVKDYGPYRLVLCLLRRPIEGVNSLVLSSIPDEKREVREELYGYFQTFERKTAYAFSYGDNLHPQTRQWEHNYELKAGTTKSFDFHRPSDNDPIESLIQVNFKGPRDHRGQLEVETPYEFVLGPEDFGCPLTLSRKSKVELIGIGLSGEGGELADPSSPFYGRASQFIRVSQLAGELKSAGLTLSEEVAEDTESSWQLADGSRILTSPDGTMRRIPSSRADREQEDEGNENNAENNNENAPALDERVLPEFLQTVPSVPLVPVADFNIALRNNPGSFVQVQVSASPGTHIPLDFLRGIAFLSLLTFRSQQAPAETPPTPPPPPPLTPSPTSVVNQPTVVNWDLSQALEVPMELDSQQGGNSDGEEGDEEAEFSDRSGYMTP